MSQRLPAEVRNELRLQADSLEKKVLAKYRVANRSHHVYRAAARLWACGVDMPTALSVINEAFDACVQETDD